MKSIEKLAIVAIVLYFVAEATRMMGPSLIITGWSPTNIAWLSFPLAATCYAVNIAIAIWLYRVAKREGDAPWVWALFGFFFSVSGAVLFYAVRIYEKINQRGNPSEPITDPLA